MTSHRLLIVNFGGGKMPTNEYEFKPLLQRLEAVVGKEMETQTADEFFLILKRFEPHVLKRAFTWTIKNLRHKTFPMPGEIFSNASFIAKEKRLEGGIPVFCQTCGGTGLAQVKTTEQKIEKMIVVRCRCQNAAGLSVSAFPRTIDHFPDPPAEEAVEPLVEYEQIQAEYKKGLAFKGTVRKVCKKCGNFYYSIYAENIPVDWIVDGYEGAISFCEPCYFECGKERGYWK